MLARLASPVALAAAVAVTLVGCAQLAPEPSATPPEAEPTPAPSLSDEEMLTEARDTFDAFYATVDAQFAAARVSVRDLQEHATEPLAESFASEIEDFLATGETSRGVLEITAIELEERTVDGVSTTICTDGSGIETRDANGYVMPAGGLVAWEMDLVWTDDGRPLIAALEPVQDQGICGA